MENTFVTLPGLSRRRFLKTTGIGLIAVPVWLHFVGARSLALAAGPAAAGPAERYFEDAFGITDEVLRKMLSESLAKGADYADLYFEHVVSRGVSMEEGVVNQSSLSVSLGVGVRALKGEACGYAFTQVLEAPAMLETARLAATLARAGGQAPGGRGVEAETLKALPGLDLYPMREPWESVATQTRIDILRRVGQRIAAKDPSIDKVQVGLYDTERRIQVVTSQGRKRADLRPSIKMVATCSALRQGRRETDHETLVGRAGLEFLTDLALESLADKVAADTLLLFEARPLAPGEMPCALSPGTSGILLHEAIGHGLEGDFNRRGQSTFTDRMGRKIASDEVTIVDSGVLPGLHGSINFDDEARDSRRTVLVDKGKLVAYLHDRLSAAHYKTSSTGSGRRESYEHSPLPRMRVTYMEPGKSDPAEIVARIKKGLLAEDFTNGEVDIGNGAFSFYVKRGWAIENGKPVHPVKDVNVTGNGPEVLGRMTMVGSDAPLAKRFDGTCGKNGQSVAVSCGQPTTYISSINVGGSNG